MAQKNQYKLTDEQIDERIRTVLKKEKIQGAPRSGNPYWREEDVILRDRAIIKLLTKGYSINESADILQERWSICHLTAIRYINKARKRLADEAEKEMDRMRAESVERLQAILVDAIENRDRKAALSALDQLNRVYGLYSDKKEISVKDLPKSFKFGE